VAPFAKTSVLLETENLVSEPYIDMTCSMMSEFGVLVRRMHYARFYIPTPQRYHPREYVVEPDLSTASYFFAAAAVTTGEVTIQAVNRETSKQGDKAFLNVLEKMGCTVIESANGLTVKGPVELHGLNVDMRDFSDTFMTLAAIAPFATTPTTITNIAHVKLKESDRILAMRTNLEKLGIKVESGNDWIKIYPGVPAAGIIDSYNDHRIAMSFSVLGLRVPGILIDNPECVSKTCPEFFELWGQL
jgi:3-phosphoshikimate 1-carboxyvinyltransferase